MEHSVAELPPPEVPELDRRELVAHLLKIGAGGLAIALGVTGSAKSLTAEATVWSGDTSTGRRFRYGMVIDTRRCVGCKSCVAACKAENKTPPGVSYNRVRTELAEGTTTDRPFFRTQPCFHCDQPPCVPVCPVDATYKRRSDGIVVVDYDRCIGCRNCIFACPYGARSFDAGENYPVVAERSAYARVPSPEYRQFRRREAGTPPIGKARKCTFCLHLQDESGRYDRQAGRWPACAKTCPGHAIHFGDLADRSDPLVGLLAERSHVRLREEWGTRPNVYYLL